MINEKYTNWVKYQYDKKILEDNHLVENTTQYVQSAGNILMTLYGRESPQARQFQEEINSTKKIFTRPDHTHSLNTQVKVARGYLKNAIEEIEQGVININQKIASGILSDFIQLSRTALRDTPGDNGKNIASVLAAAIFEDTVRRMGQEFSGITDRIKLEEVISKLSDDGIIESPQKSLYIGYLPFRNHALHAEWDKIERGTVESCLSFVEGILLKYF